MRVLVIVLAMMLYTQSSYAQDLWRLEPSTPLLGAGGDARAVSGGRGAGYVLVSALVGGILSVPALVLAAPTGQAALPVASVATIVINALATQGAGWLFDVDRSWATSFTSSVIGAVLGWGLGFVFAQFGSGSGFGDIAGMITGIVFVPAVVTPLVALWDPFDLTAPAGSGGAMPDARPVAVPVLQPSSGIALSVLSGAF